QATEDEAGEAAGPQDVVQLCPVEGVGRRLSQVDVATFRLQPRRQLPAVGPVVHVTATLRLVLDDDDERTCRSGLAGNQVDAIDDTFDFKGSVLAGTKNLLDIDDEKGGWHRCRGLTSKENRQEPRPRSGHELG